MFIIGAGMAGLLAAHIFRNERPTILEAQSNLPSNHEALLRFRSTKVADATGIKFVQASVRKAIVYKDQFADKANMFLANMYSHKVVGEIRERSIWNLEQSVRHIAPHDFVARMAAPFKVEYDAAIKDLETIKDLALEGPVISTIPMPALMRIVGWNASAKFHSLPIWSAQVGIVAPNVSVYQTIYYPDPELPYYRASITGSRLIVEFSREPKDLELHINSILLDFGIPAWVGSEMPEPKEHRLGKITPVDEDARKDFIYSMTREHNIYSLGRFATWKQVLLDDVVDDCEVIRRLIAVEGRRSAYHQSLATVGGRH